MNDLKYSDSNALSNTKTSNSPKKEVILSDNYIFVKQIGSGSFGEVYIAEHKIDGNLVAAKVEKRKNISRIIHEYKIYKYLNSHNMNVGLPNVYDFIQTPDFNIMFMQLLGPNLDEIFSKYNKKLTLPTVLLLGMQIISLLKQLHNNKIIHRDIKPNNFLIGKANDNKQIYVMDFGLSKKYINKGEHLPFRDNKSLIGTARYASVNMHIGIEPSRRDDLESVGYMLVYFLIGRLPWQGLKKEKGVNHIEKIGDVKMCTSLDILCEDVPVCFKEYISYCRKLRFDEQPDYLYLMNLFKNYCTEYKIIPNFEWVN